MAGFEVTTTRTATNVPISLSVSDSSGGVTGLTCVVAIRDGATTNSYLDFDDDTFKTSGWTTRQASLADIGGGFYALSGGLDISAITNLPASTDHMLVELESSGSVNGITIDIIRIRDDSIDTNVDEIHKIHGLDSSNPMTVSATARSSGSVSQTIADGGATVTVTRS